MKKLLRYFLLLIVTLLVLVGSYFIGLRINDYTSLDMFFKELTQPWIYYVIGMKIFIMAVFLLFSMDRFRYLLNFTGLMVSNAAAFGFLNYQQALSDQQWVYLIVLGLEILLLLLFGAFVNEISKPSVVPDEKQDNITPAIKAEPGVEMVVESPAPEVEWEEPLMTEQAVEQESVFEPLKEQKDPVPLAEARSERAAEPEKAMPMKETLHTEVKAEEKESPTSCPIRIDIDMEDLKRCFEQYNRLTGKEEDIRIESKQQETQIRLEAIKSKEQELKDRIAVVRSKEKIIEKTITNLEQISKTIKDRTATLEEREAYVKSQLERIEALESSQGAVVQNKIYDLIFEDLDIMDHEVKLKDEKREIIIDKNDLTEIRRNIEDTMDEARKGMGM